MKIQIGELRGEFSFDIRKRIEEVIDRFQHKKNPYYMLIYSEDGLDVFPADAPSVRGFLSKQGKLMEVDGKRVIRTRIMVMDTEPERILGTMCYKVDNQRGQLLRLWVLPQDIPELDRVVDEDGVVREVLEDAQIIGKFIT